MKEHWENVNNLLKEGKKDEAYELERAFVIAHAAKMYEMGILSYEQSISESEAIAAKNIDFAWGRDLPEY